VTSVLAEFGNNIIENIILPKRSALVIIRFIHQVYDDPQEVEGAYYMENIQRNRTVKLSYPIPRKSERSLHTCAQDVQITCMATI
jgi:hypothetical protein